MKLRIEKAIYGGDGLAHSPDGKALFVPGTLPGELVEATIEQQKRGFATGALQTILEPSADRVMPGCEYFPRCGGCQYQHASAASQLQMKLAILQETLARAHLSSPGEIGILSGPPWGYRNRVRLHVVNVPSGIALAYRQRGSHNLLPVSHCPIAAPLLQNAIAAVTRIGLETGLETGLANLCDEVEFFTNGDQDQLLVTLWPGPRTSGRNTEDALETFAEQLHAQIPQLAGVGMIASGQVAYWGQRFLTYPLAGHSYQVSMGGFFQVNIFLLPQLLELVLQGAGAGGTTWDLYAGAGLFAKALPCNHVTAVESAGFSADDLQHNLAGKSSRVVRASTLDFLRKPVKVKPDLILVDPPRAGLGKETCSLLGVLAAPRIVSISCDPATLARDLQSLLPYGYAIESIHLVDLFPQTFHMETVTFLKRI